MNRLYALLLLCLPALSCPAEDKDKDKETVRVLTFNLRYINSSDKGAKAWTERRDAVAELIKKDAADFIGTQEALRVMLDDVKARVPGYGELGVGREDGKEKGEYSAILYRQAAWEVTASGTFWLSDTPEVVASSTWGNKVTRVCTWGKFKHKVSGRELFFFNAHLDHQSQPSREKATALILQRIRDRGSKAPVIMTGDFNAGPENPAIAIMQKGPPAFTDAWLSLHKETPAAEAGTFHDFSGKQNSGHIDYIFSSPEITPVESAILHDEKDGKYPSDHFPVRATLKFL
jgi:endonuclease/exonuclease/phosphatase family metal-dependent hydrolase